MFWIPYRVSLPCRELAGELRAHPAVTENRADYPAKVSSGGDGSGGAGHRLEIRAEGQLHEQPCRPVIVSCSVTGSAWDERRAWRGAISTMGSRWFEERSDAGERVHPAAYLFRGVRPRRRRDGANKQFRRANFRRTAGVKGPVREMPVFANRIKIDPMVTDRFGILTARITGSRHPRDLEVGKFIAKQAERWLGKPVTGAHHQAHLPYGKRPENLCRPAGARATPPRSAP